MFEDYIDFPCSADWLEHYNNMGLTPRKPNRDRQMYKEIKEMIKQTQMQQKVLEMMFEQFNETLVMLTSILKEMHNELYAKRQLDFQDYRYKTMKYSEKSEAGEDRYEFFKIDNEQEQ